MVLILFLGFKKVIAYCVYYS